MKLFNLKLNSVCFLGEPFRDFFITVSLDVFISSCFLFFMFSFLYVFISSDLFGCFHCWLHMFTSLFPQCFFTIYSLLCCYCECYGFEREGFTLRSFIPNNLYLLLSRLPWGRQFCLEGWMVSHWGLKHRPSPSVCLNHTVFGNYMISRELNIWKYVDKLLVVKSLINLKHFS